MKVRINAYVNLRTELAEIHPYNNPGDLYFSPGDIINVAETVIGENYKGNNLWYRLEEGGYVWSGGGDKFDFANLIPKTKEFPSWMLNLNIDKVWKYATGKNVGVAVIDTGINTQNPDLIYNNNHFTYDKNISIADSHGHGTHCAGLIGARNKSNYKIGVAPECNLYICKIAENGAIAEKETSRFIDAINWCTEQENIHVISISWAIQISDPVLKEDLKKAVDRATAKNKVILASIGHASSESSKSIRYPACYKNSIGIGIIPVTDTLYSNKNDFLTTVSDGFNIFSYEHVNQGIKAMSGSSQSNAILAGIVALIIEKIDFKYTPESIKSHLIKLSKTKVIIKEPLSVFDGELFLNFMKI